MAIKRTIRRNSEINNILLSDAFDEYIAEKNARGLAEPTINNYCYSFSKFSEFIGNKNTGSSINVGVIYKWITSMKDENVKYTSINHYLREIRTFLYWCMNEDRQYVEPFKIELQKGQEEIIKVYSEDEQKALLEKPRNKNDFTEARTYTIVNFVLDSGSRAATICNVKLEDVDLTNKQIVLTHTKNKKAQILPISSVFETTLKDYIRTWRRNADPTDYLFCNQGEEKLTTNALRISFGRYCKAREVTKTSIHGLRHSFAKGYIKNNGSSFKLQKILGHSTLDMTRKYVNLFTDDLQEDFDIYSPLGNLKKGLNRTKTIKRTGKETAQERKYIEYDS
ncbi:MAG: tyrosine-type recombinase/integrase [Oscillospiraceae bacterium]|jgi:integrase/recombinase XerD|nr:tyrosine-type recombinase/integrase [Oscillospiraceae bacterium]